MKRKLTIAFLFLLIAGAAAAQYRSANWPLTYNNLVLKITKDTLARDSLSNGTHGFCANTSISDNEGNLLFYSQGVDARNKMGGLMDSGCCLCESLQDPANCDATENGNPHFQGALILPVPGNTNQFYLFIKDMDSVFTNGPEQPMRVTASIIDMSESGGLGMVVNRDR